MKASSQASTIIPADKVRAPIAVKYAVHDGVDLWLDIYVPPSATETKIAPIYVWFHYGGLVQV